jgi:ribosomal-protein-serine acetyltransferase
MKIFVDSNIELQQLKLFDSVDIFNMLDSQRDYFGIFLPFVEFTKNLEDTQCFVDSVLNAPEELFELVFTIRYKFEFVGIIGFKSTDKQNKKTEIGYWLSKDLQGKGIVSKSVKKLVDYAFSELSMNRIQIKLAVGNHKSKNIPERLGFMMEGIERDGELLTGGLFTDLCVYSKLKAEHTI